MGDGQYQKGPCTMRSNSKIFPSAELITSIVMLLYNLPLVLPESAGTEVEADALSLFDDTASEVFGAEQYMGGVVLCSAIFCASY